MQIPRRGTALILSCGLLASLPALAADEPRYNQVSLRAEVSKEVARDLMVVTLYSEAQNTDPGKLAKQITETMNKAVQQSRQVKDVKISQAGGRVLVTVVENPVIGRVAFEGNKKVKDDQLTAEVQSKPRGTLSRPMVQADALHIVERMRLLEGGTVLEIEYTLTDPKSWEGSMKWTKRWNREVER